VLQDSPGRDVVFYGDQPIINFANRDLIGVEVDAEYIQQGPLSPLILIDSSQAFSATLLPEPGTWSFMLLGLGFVGAAMRRRTAGRQRLA